MFQMLLSTQMLSHGTVLHLTSNGRKRFSKMPHQQWKRQNLCKLWSQLNQVPQLKKLKHLHKLKSLKKPQRKRRSRNQKRKLMEQKGKRSQAKRVIRKLQKKLRRRGRKLRSQLNLQQSKNSKKIQTISVHIFSEIFLWTNRIVIQKLDSQKNMRKSVILVKSRMERKCEFVADSTDLTVKALSTSCTLDRAQKLSSAVDLSTIRQLVNIWLSIWAKSQESLLLKLSVKQQNQRKKSKDAQIKKWKSSFLKFGQSTDLTMFYHFKLRMPVDWYLIRKKRETQLVEHKQKKRRKERKQRQN